MWRQGSLIRFFSYVFQVLLPFHREKMFFGVVAFLAGCNDVAFGTSAAAGYGNDMVHGQFFGRRGAPAVMADPFGTSSLPPLGIAQLPGLAALFVDIFFRQIIGKWFHFNYQVPS